MTDARLSFFIPFFFKPMKQLYTRTGDSGLTSLREGVRVEKDDLRIEVNGQVDHLNALLAATSAQQPCCRPTTLHSSGGCRRN